MANSFVAACVVLMSAGAAAVAQCPPVYSGTIGTPGVQDGYIDPMFVWNGELYVGGSFSQIGTLVTPVLARYNASNGSWSRVGTGLNIGFTNGFLTSMVNANFGAGDRLLVAGRFTSAGGVANTEAIAAWNGTSWSSLGLGVPAGNAIWDMEVGSIGQGQRLFVGGGFGIPFGGVAQYDGSTWSPVGAGIGLAGPFSPYISDMVIFNDGSGPALYVGGRFASVDNVAAPMIARFNGTTWSNVGFGLTTLGSAFAQIDALTVFDDGTGPALYAGGTAFGIVGRSGTFFVAKWNGTTWQPVGQNLQSGRVTALRAWNDGNGTKLYLAATACPAINNFARLDGNTWVQVDGSLRDSSTFGAATSGNFPSAFGLGELGSSLLVGGSFVTIGPVPARGIATLNRGNCCVADWDRNGEVEPVDIRFFFDSYRAGNADVDGNGETEPPDIIAFFAVYRAGC